MVLLLYKAKSVPELSCMIDSSHMTVISSGRSELEEAVVIYTLPVKTRRPVEHCTLHADGTRLHFTGLS